MKIPWYLKQDRPAELSDRGTITYHFRITRLGAFYLALKMLWQKRLVFEQKREDEP